MTDEIKPSQHCTSKECGYTLSHTAEWCGYSQPRRCDCAFCYPSKTGNPNPSNTLWRETSMSNNETSSITDAVTTAVPANLTPEQAANYEANLANFNLVLDKVVAEYRKRVSEGVQDIEIMTSLSFKLMMMSALDEMTCSTMFAAAIRRLALQPEPVEIVATGSPEEIVSLLHNVAEGVVVG